MRTPSASAEPPAPESGRNLALPDAELVSAAWLDYPVAAGLPTRPDMAKSVSRAMLAIGIALLFFAPLGAVFLLIAGVLGLTMTASPTNQPSPTNQ